MTAEQKERVRIYKKEYQRQLRTNYSVRDGLHDKGGVILKNDVVSLGARCQSLVRLLEPLGKTAWGKRRSGWGSYGNRRYHFGDLQPSLVAVAQRTVKEVMAETLGWSQAHFAAFFNVGAVEIRTGR